MVRWLVPLLPLLPLLLLLACAVVHADEPPAPPPVAPPAGLEDAPWKREAEDLERRAQEAESKQDHKTALDLRISAIALLCEKRPESFEIAVALNETAFTLDFLGRAAEAMPFYEESLAMQRRLFPGDHPGVALRLNNLGRTLEALGRACPVQRAWMGTCSSQ